MIDYTGTSLQNLCRSVALIGNTPLAAFSLRVNDRASKLALKLEGENPTGSMKDRTAISLIQDFEERGYLNEASTIIESTSGNLGVALALICKARGYDFIAVVDPKASEENIHKMQALEARIERVDQQDETGGYLLTRLKRVAELCHRSPQFVWTNQYGNPANPRIHYSQTGPEIYEQMRGKVDAIFVPVSTGGTLAGIGRFFREVSPTTCIIGVDAYGSIIFGSPAAPRKLNGIGSSRCSDFLQHWLYDAYEVVRDEEAFGFCRAFSQKTGLRLGGSGGAVLVACVRFLTAYPGSNSNMNICCVCADRGENYTSTIYNDEWIAHQDEQLFQQKVQKMQSYYNHLLASLAYVGTKSLSNKK
jgi:2,3-diaminopropionate biosynthesis protein SbnA